MTHTEFIRDFQKRYKQDHKDKPTVIVGLHPKHGLPKKETSFYPGFCHVLFDRKTIPKGGKSIIDGCFVKEKDHYQLVYDRETRALLGLDVTKIKQYKELLHEQYRLAESDRGI